MLIANKPVGASQGDLGDGHVPLELGMREERCVGCAEDVGCEVNR